MLQASTSSTQLLRSLSRQSKLLAVQCQTRAYGDKFANFTPRHKYAKVNRLDKLHRKQKEEMRKMQEDSKTRAEALKEVILKDATAPKAQNLGYHIERTGTGNLPVYESAKGGGTKLITTVRRLSGDLKAMQVALQTVLQLPESYVDGKGRKKSPVEINHLTKHIIVRGQRGPEIKAWAQAVGF